MVLASHTHFLISLGLRASCTGFAQFYAIHGRPDPRDIDLRVAENRAIIAPDASLHDLLQGSPCGGLPCGEGVPCLMGCAGHSSRLANGLEGAINALKISPREDAANPIRASYSSENSRTASANGTSRQSSVFEIR